MFITTFFLFQKTTDGWEFKVYSRMQIYSKWTFDRPFPQTLLIFIANPLVSCVTTNLHIARLSCPLPTTPILIEHFEEK